MTKGKRDVPVRMRTRWAADGDIADIRRRAAEWRRKHGPHRWVVGGWRFEDGVRVPVIERVVDDGERQ